MQKAILVEQLMTRSAVTCLPSDTLAHAAQLMWCGDFGCLPIVDASGKTVGMITDRDICMAALLQDRALRETRVETAMSKTVASCSPSNTVWEAQQIMRGARVRRLPVLVDGALGGVLSLTDLAQAAAGLQTRSRPPLTGEEIGITLACVTQPREPCSGTNPRAVATLEASLAT